MGIIMDIDAADDATNDADDFAENKFQPFAAEVLNAQWLPQPQVELDVSVEVATIHATVPSPEPAMDADAFLRNVYLIQE